MRDIDLIIVHHSASALNTTAKDIAVWHAKRFKLGIGYHRIIEYDGSVLDGRKIQRTGAHTKGRNTNSVGICVVGDNTVSGRHWTTVQRDSLELTLLYFADLYPAARICGHCDVPGAATLCPGLDIATWCASRNMPVAVLNRAG